MQRHRRVKAERAEVHWTLVQTLGRRRPSLPVVIRLTRYAPSPGLDSDNLQSSLKATRDAIAAWLGINDADEAKARYAYAQQRARAYGVRIEFVPMQTDGLREHEDHEPNAAAAAAQPAKGAQPMNLHTPERQPNETREQYAARRKASREQAKRSTKPERPMPIGLGSRRALQATPHDNWGNR